MSASKPVFKPELETAFAALGKYPSGASRADLLPIDAGISRSASDSALRRELERRLVRALETCGTQPAQEYICNRLAMIGGAESVPALAGLVGSAKVGTAARTALEANPSSDAGKALRDSLKKLTGLAKVGSVTSLGVRADQRAMRALASCMKDPDAHLASAAAAAVGEMGTTRAARLLRAFMPKASNEVVPAVQDALKVCEKKLSLQR